MLRQSLGVPAVLFTGSMPLSLGGSWPLPVDVSLPRMIVIWRLVVEVPLTLVEVVTEDVKLVELPPLVWFVAVSCCGRNVPGKTAG